MQKVFVINLQRRPERLSHFYKECKRTGVPLSMIHIWPAVDGMTHTFTASERQLFVHSDLDMESETGRGCMGNQLSHLQILQHIVDQDIEMALIFQDDVKLGDHFWDRVQEVAHEMKLHPHLPIVWVGLHQVGAGSYFEELNLAQHNFHDYFDTRISERLAHLLPTVNPASLAYLITKEGAQKYLQFVEMCGIRHATDINYRDFLLQDRTFVGCFPLLCTGNASFKSDIFKYDDHAMMRDMLEMLGDKENE